MTPWQDDAAMIHLLRKRLRHSLREQSGALNESASTGRTERSIVPRSQNSVALTALKFHRKRLSNRNDFSLLLWSHHSIPLACQIAKI